MVIVNGGFAKQEGVPAVSEVASSSVTRPSSSLPLEPQQNGNPSLSTGIHASIQPSSSAENLVITFASAPSQPNSTGVSSRGINN